LQLLQRHLAVLVLVRTADNVPRQERPRPETAATAATTAPPAATASESAGARDDALDLRGDLVLVELALLVLVRGGEELLHPRQQLRLAQLLVLVLVEGLQQRFRQEVTHPESAAAETAAESAAESAAAELGPQLVDAGGQGRLVQLALLA